jgi:hypothetical protein
MKNGLNSGGRLISTYGVGSPISRPSNIANYNSAKVGSKLRKSDFSPDALHRRGAVLQMPPNSGPKRALSNQSQSITNESLVNAPMQKRKLKNSELRLGRKFRRRGS